MAYNGQDMTYNGILCAVYLSPTNIHTEEALDIFPEKKYVLENNLL